MSPRVWRVSRTRRTEKKFPTDPTDLAKPLRSASALNQADAYSACHFEERSDEKSQRFSEISRPARNDR